MYVHGRDSTRGTISTLLHLRDFSFSGELAKMEFRGNGKKMDLDSYVVYVFGTFWVKFID